MKNILHSILSYLLRIRASLLKSGLFFLIHRVPVSNQTKQNRNQSATAQQHAGKKRVVVIRCPENALGYYEFKTVKS